MLFSRIRFVPLIFCDGPDLCLIGRKRRVHVAALYMGFQPDLFKSLHNN